MNKAILIACILLAVSAIIFADEYKQAREVKPVYGDSKIQIESKMRSAAPSGEADKLNFEFEASENLVLKMKYALGASKTEGEYKIKLFGIHEYNTTTAADGSYVDKVSKVVSTYVFKSWNKIGCSNTKVDTNTTLFNCTITSKDNVVSANVFFTDSVINANSKAGFPMKPTSIKFTVTINNFPYKGLGSSLALIAKMVSERNTNEKSDSDERKNGFVKTAEKQVDIGSEAYFSWATSALADGVSVAVVNTKVEKLNSTEAAEPNENRMFFSFIAKTPKSIVWDPKLGAIDNSAAKFSASLLALILLFAFLLL